jgi:hypothetical protein
MCNVFTHFIYMILFLMCFDVFHFSLFLWLSLCQLYSHMRVPYSICDSNIQSYHYYSWSPVYLVWKVRPVCPMYFRGQTIHFIWHMTLFSYLSICEWGSTMFCIVFLIRNATFICDSLKNSDFLCFSSAICKKKWRMPHEMYGLPTDIHRAEGPKVSYH